MIQAVAFLMHAFLFCQMDSMVLRQPLQTVHGSGSCQNQADLKGN